MTSKGFRYFKIVFLTLIIMFSIYSLIPDSSNTINWQKPNKIDFIQNGKPAFLDFYADWCIPCKELDKLTFSDNDIIDESTRFQNFKIDITKSTSDISKQFIQKYNIKGVPTLIIIDSNGKEIKRITGFISAKILLVELKKVN